LEIRLVEGGCNFDENVVREGGEIGLLGRFRGRWTGAEANGAGGIVGSGWEWKRGEGR
jgi:hypothetical protein